MSLTYAPSERLDWLSAAEDLRQNAGQWAVYESTGNCVVLAGPGSGKTKTLTIKMARMLSEDVRPPRAIACLTYSNECVRELKRRLAKLGVSDGPSVFIGTVHSFCLKHVLVPCAKLAGINLPEPLRIASPNEQDRVFQSVLAHVIGRNEYAPNWRVGMDRLRRTQLDRNSQELVLEHAEMSKLMDAYEQALTQDGLVDFDGIVLKGLQIVEQNEWVGRLLSAKFPILVVDEYQDLGLPLHRLVLSLCLNAGVRLLAVGDPDQSIYGFTGSKPELLRKLAKMLEVDPVQLRLNYRCARKIVTASQVILGEDKGYEACDNAHDGVIHFCECGNGMADQAEYICETVIPALRTDGVQLGDIAILYPTKQYGDAIADKVSGCHLPFIRIDSNAPYRKTPFTTWLEDCAAWCSGGWKVGKPPLSVLLRNWIAFNSSVCVSDSAILAAKRTLVRFLWSHRGPEDTLCQWLDGFHNECLSEMLSRETTLGDDRDAFDQLDRAAGVGGAIEQFTLADFAGQSGTPDHLNLITLHSAKGREFDAVVMMGMDQGHIPRQDCTEGERMEARRLFYVGLTRARREVYMTYSGWIQGRYGRWELGPSEFLVQLQEAIAA